MGLFKRFISEDSIRRERGWRQEEPLLSRNSSWKGVHKAEDPSNGQNPGLRGHSLARFSFLLPRFTCITGRAGAGSTPKQQGDENVHNSSPSPPLVCQNHFRYPEAGEQVWVPCPQPQPTLAWHVMPRSPATVVLHRSCSLGEGRT